jgi:hypothetical protein
LPHPQSVEERRTQFDREHLIGDVLVDAVPNDAQPVGAVFDHRFELVAARTEPRTPQRGDVVRVEYYWRVLEPSARDFRVFIHGDALEGSYRRLHADHWPAEGRYPTGVWRVGDLVRDVFELPIPRSYGPPRLGLYSGLYRGDDRLRLNQKGSRPSDRENRSLAVEFRFQK